MRSRGLVAALSALLACTMLGESARAQTREAQPTETNAPPQHAAPTSSAKPSAPAPRPSKPTNAASRAKRLERAREIFVAMKSERLRHRARMKELDAQARVAKQKKDDAGAQKARDAVISEQMLHAKRMRDLRVKNEQNHTAVPKG